jgi:hypothetical protein
MFFLKRLDHLFFFIYLIPVIYSQLCSPGYGASEEAGTVVFLENCYIKTVKYGGQNDPIDIGTPVTNLVGSASCNSNAWDGVGTSARFARIYAAVLVPGSTELLVSDLQASKLRRVNYNSLSVTTFLNKIEVSFYPVDRDGTGTAASIAYPHSLTMSNNPNALYVGTQNNVRRVTYPGAVVSTLNIPNYVSNYKNFQSISSDSRFMIMTDRDLGTVHKFDFSSNTLLTIAGNGNAYDCKDGVGTNAQFSRPTYTAISSSGSVLFIADSFKSLKIRKMDMTTLYVSCLTGSCPERISSDNYYIQGMILSSDETYLLSILQASTSSVNYVLQRIDTGTGAVNVINPSSGPAYDLRSVYNMLLIPGAKGACLLCGSGKFSLDGSSCRTCPAGSFCGLSSVTQCPAGNVIFPHIISSVYADMI